jgi:hypothetical protein
MLLFLILLYMIIAILWIKIFMLKSILKGHSENITNIVNILQKLYPPEE